MLKTWLRLLRVAENRRGMRQALESKYKDAQLQMKGKIEEVIPAGNDMVIERGSYIFFDRQGAETDVGKYMALHKKIDGQWLVHWNMYNSSKPESDNI